jgi:hypothetical protein
VKELKESTNMARIGGNTEVLKQEKLRYGNKDGWTKRQYVNK